MTPNELAQALLENDGGESAKEWLLRTQDLYRVKYLVFKTGTGPYGSGGWSRNARHRPQPTTVVKDTRDVEFKGKSVIVDGVRRLKCNVWRNFDKKPVRIDYPDLPYE